MAPEEPYGSWYIRKNMWCGVQEHERGPLQVLPCFAQTTLHQEKPGMMILGKSCTEQRARAELLEPPRCPLHNILCKVYSLPPIDYQVSQF
jgi:hypothetical protein